MAVRKNPPGNVVGRDPFTGRFTSMTPEQFASELRRKSYEPPTRLHRTTVASCKRVEAQAKANVLQTAPVHNGNAYKYIDYEVNDTETGVAGIVGYNRIYKAARLGNLLEFGGGGDPSPAHYDIARALEAEEDKFFRNIADDAEAYLVSRWGE